jgi:phage terminase large subunit-like protein
MSAICPAYALAHVAPEFWDDLSDAELLVASYDLSLWLRPDQIVPHNDFRSFGVIAGRGWGKSLAIAYEINRRVEAGECRAPALMAPTDDRVKEVQVDFLVSTSPPWFQAEPYGKGVRWPNGVVAIAFTPEAPGHSRSGNFDLSWMCEIVDWQESTRKDAYDNLATATRVGKAQVFWDSTSKGHNDVLQHLLAENAAYPEECIIRRGTTYDNPLLSEKYLRALLRQYPKGSRGRQEELDGLVFGNTEGALCRQSWIDQGRRAQAPSEPVNVILSLDTALSTSNPEGTIVDECARDAAGVVIETNHAGELPRDLIKVVAEKRGMAVVLLAKEDRGKPFPRRKPGVIFIREVNSVRGKESRATAPCEMVRTQQVHFCGRFAELEGELISWVPGKTKSPNRLDAWAQGVNELAGTHIFKRRATPGDIAAAAAAMRTLVTGGRIGAGSRGPSRGGLGI